MKFSVGDERNDSGARGADVASIETVHASVQYPTSFVVTEYEGADLVLAYKDDLAGFRPNLVLTSVASTAPLADACVTAMLAASAQHPSAQVHSCDVWDLIDPDAAPRARRVTFSYRGDEVLDVLVYKWVWATGSHHVHLSASCLPSQAEAFAPTFEWVALQLRITAGAEALAAAATAVGEAPIDAPLTERVGYPMEDLSAVENPAFHSRGPVVGTPALRLLVEGSRRTRLGASLGVLAKGERGSEDARGLERAGWADERGRLTPLGAAVAETMAVNRHVATVKLRRRGRAELLIAYSGPRGVLVLHGPSLGEPALPEADLRHAVFVSAEQTPGLIAAWIGVRPFWSVSDGEERVTPDELERHLSAADDDVDMEPWTECFLRDARGERYDVLSPTRGFLSIGAPTSGVQSVRPDPSGALFDHILRGCDVAFAVA